MICITNSCNKEKEDAQKCPTGAEHQKAPSIRDAVVNVKIAKAKILIGRMTAENMDS
jgi:hypothetical protein